MEEVKKKYRVKIGSRVLSEGQLKKLLPNNEEIHNRIAIIRKYSSEYKITRKEFNNTCGNYMSRELDGDCNNIFSILGGRGSGKTSVLLTIKNKLTNESDIMLPLIIPENMGEASNVLGWTICAFEKIIENIEKEIYTNNSDIGYEFFKDCRRNDNNKLRRAFGEVLKYYTYINKEYRQILNVNYDGFNDYKIKTKEVINAERELLSKFEEFIETIVEVKKNIYKNNEKEPLVYIFFDDVDLSTERCLEIVSIILKYLSNPNIVVFVAGNYSTFAETLTINLLTKDGLLNNTNEFFDKNDDMGGRSALETRKILAQDILKKVLPPADRFYMATLNNKAKSEFIYSTRSENEDEYEKLVDLINRKLMNIKDRKKGFLYYNDELIEIYFNIFDSNPRGLMNVYYFLYGLQRNDFIIKDKNKEGSNDEDIAKKQKKYCEMLKEFLKVIIDSNPELGDMRSQIYAVIDIKDSLQEIFINYEYIMELYSNEINKEERRGGKNKKTLGKKGKLIGEKYIKLFLLAHFIENIIVSRLKMDDIQKNTHGIKIFIEIVNSINQDNLIPKYENSEFILVLYSKIKDKLEGVIKNKCDGYNINYFTKVYFYILYNLVFKENKENNFNETLSKIIRTDHKWVEEKIAIILETKCEKHIFLIKAINELNDLVDINSLNNNFRKEIFLSINTYVVEAENISKDLYASYLITELNKVIKNEKFNYQLYFNEINKNHMNIEGRKEIALRFKELIYTNEDSLLYLKSQIIDEVYVISIMFKNKFKKIFSDPIFKIEEIDEEEKILLFIEEVQEIINRDNNEINGNELNRIKDILRYILTRGRRIMYTNNFEELDYLYKLANDFEIKQLAPRDFEKDEFIFLIKENILLKTFIYMLERQRCSNDEFYEKIEAMNKELQDNNLSMMLKKVIDDKKNQMSTIKIEYRDSKDV